LQVRPFAERSETETVEIGAYPDEALLCRSERALGNGVVTGITDVVFVDRDRFDRAKSVDVARDVAAINSVLVQKRVPYVLIGVGRWGASDPWLGIPVTWEQINGARAIVEANFKDFDVTPSQGSHFFQNLAASLVGYFTVGERDLVAWDRLKTPAPRAQHGIVRHVRLERPLEIRMDGRTGKGVIVM
jgi:hypothetical protein